MDDPDYPPKNRRTTELDVLRIEVEHAGGIEAYDPNGILGFLYRNGPTAFERFRPVPGCVSALSGRPALLYRSVDVEVPLAPDEVYRLAAYELAPEEFFKLRDLLGTFFETHSDFYRPRTGEALQPLSRR